MKVSVCSRMDNEAQEAPLSVFPRGGLPVLRKRPPEGGEKGLSDCCDSCRFAEVTIAVAERVGSDITNIVCVAEIIRL